MLFLYNLIYSPALFLLSIFRWVNPKISKGFQLRKKMHSKVPWLNSQAALCPIWIHCASGEFEYAKSVIRELKKQKPNEKILVTYFSPSVENSIKNFPGVDFYCPTPWDKPKLWLQFIKHHEPKVLLISRTDLWPAMIDSCVKNKIPRLLFSKTINENSGAIKNFIATRLMKKMTDIFCVSETDRELLYKKIKPYQNIHNSGDTRYDQCLFRLQNSKPLKPLNNFNKPIFIAGSTWPKDEETIYPLIKNKIRELSFIIAPHEPSFSHLESIKKELKKQDTPFQLYSQTQSWNPEAVLLIDQVGILADLYAWSLVSFVGGSMDRSVHSVLEPLAHGNLTFIGPNHSNNREALTFKTIDIKGIPSVAVIESSQELIEKVAIRLKDWTNTHRFELQHTVKAKQGATLKVLKWIENNHS